MSPEFGIGYTPFSSKDVAKEKNLVLLLGARMKCDAEPAWRPRKKDEGSLSAPIQVQVYINARFLDDTIDG